MREKYSLKISYVLGTTLLLFFVFSQSTDAAFNDGNAMCTPVITACPCGTVPKDGGCTGGKNMHLCECFDVTNKAKTLGVCTAQFTCTAKSAEGIDGGMKGIEGLDKLLGEVFGKLMEQLMKGSGGGGGEQQQQWQQGDLYPRCVRNPATNTVSPVPCTESNGSINYGGGGSGSLLDGSGALGGGSTADALLKALGGDAGEVDESINTNTNTNINTNTNTNQNQNTNTNDSSNEENGEPKAEATPNGLSQEQQSLSPGGSVLQGDILVGGSGGTLLVRSRDPQSNTEVAGFYGGSTLGQTQSSSLIGGLCAKRPWSQGLIGGLLPATVFDGLCQRFGYQVGVAPVPVAGAPTTSANTVRRPTITITQNPTPSSEETVALNPEVDIWANPASVRLGSRTYIFWNSRDVVSCKEAGPNFSHDTLSGGASTIPLSDASTFTIECTTSDGQTITDSVVVNLAL